MNFYYDTSVLAKLFLEEPDSTDWSAIHEEATMIATSWMTFAEMHSLLKRREREKKLTGHECQHFVTQFKADWDRFGKIEARPPLLKHAASLIVKYPLKALDAIHLASALYFQEQMEESVIFLTADRQLEAAARREKLQTRI